MKNTKSKIELMENEINSKARKAYATTVARRDAERCGDIPVTCTPAVAAVKPMRGELAQEPYTPEQVLNNLKIIREDLRDFPMSLDGGPGYARYIADSIIERGILGAETLEAKFAAGWQKSIEAGSVRGETRHTQELTHNARCDTVIKCDLKKFTAKSTATQTPIPTQSKKKQDREGVKKLADSAAAKKSGGNGKGLSLKLSKPTAENVIVVEKQSRDFSQLTTPKEMDAPTEARASEDGDFISGLPSAITQKTGSGFCATTAIVQGASLESAHTKNNFTPGPWGTGCLMTQVEVNPPDWKVPMIIADCHPDKGYCPDNEPERCANARLIAAAPDLLAALENILHEADFDSDGDSASRGEKLLAIEDMAKDAIAKARGQ